MRVAAMVFEDRRDAGRILAGAIEVSREWVDAIVLGLPRGGVPVAYEVARALDLPLDIFMVRKLGVPGEEELAMGAIASDGTVVINRCVVRELAISAQSIEAVAGRERLEMERRERIYRNGHPPARIDRRTAILIDDGLATGASMLAAARALRPRVRQVIVAVPVAAQNAWAELRNEVEKIICVATPEPFFSVGSYYRDFEQTADDEVRTLLSRARRTAVPFTSGGDSL
jgi:putative phosphoribosyl transferase